MAAQLLRNDDGDVYATPPCDLGLWGGFHVRVCGLCLAVHMTSTHVESSLQPRVDEERRRCDPEPPTWNQNKETGSAGTFPARSFCVILPNARPYFSFPSSNPSIWLGVVKHKWFRFFSFCFFFSRRLIKHLFLRRPDMIGPNMFSWTQHAPRSPPTGGPEEFEMTQRRFQSSGTRWLMSRVQTWRNPGHD